MKNKKIESDSTDGIRILTIHKSKGLEYKNVIVPFYGARHQRFRSLRFRIFLLA